MSKIETPEKIQDLPLSLIKNIITLATSGFGLVVALAWNEVIQTLVKLYVDPWLGKNGSLVSLIVYALLITFLAVFFTMQLTQLQKRVAHRLTPAKKSTKKSSRSKSASKSAAAKRAIRK